MQKWALRGAQAATVPNALHSPRWLPSIRGSPASPLPPPPAHTTTTHLVALDALPAAEAVERRRLEGEPVELAHLAVGLHLLRLEGVKAWLLLGHALDCSGGDGGNAGGLGACAGLACPLSGGCRGQRAVGPGSQPQWCICWAQACIRAPQRSARRAALGRVPWGGATCSVRVRAAVQLGHPPCISAGSLLRSLATCVSICCSEKNSSSEVPQLSWATRVRCRLGAAASACSRDQGARFRDRG